MTPTQREWSREKEKMMHQLRELGFPDELGDAMAKQLGSPKAISRMSAYLYNVRPESVELVVDEMLAITSEIDAWREKKIGEEANARYTELLNRGFGSD